MAELTWGLLWAMQRSHDWSRGDLGMSLDKCRDCGTTKADPVAYCPGRLIEQEK